MRKPQQTKNTHYERHHILVKKQLASGSERFSQLNVLTDLVLHFIVLGKIMSQPVH